MIGKVFCFVLVLVVASGGENVEEDLAKEIEEARESIRAASAASAKEVSAFGQRIGETFDYLEHSVKEYQKNVEKKYGAAVRQIGEKTEAYVVEGVDKKKGYNTFKCLVKVAAESSATVEGGMEAYSKCTESQVRSSREQLGSCGNQVDIVDASLKALFEPLLESVSGCKSKDCVKGVVNKSNSRGESVRRIVREHADKIGDMRSAFGQGVVQCNRNAQAAFENGVKNCDSKMKAC